MELEFGSDEYPTIKEGSDAYKAYGFERLDAYLAEIGWDPLFCDPSKAESSSPVKPETDVRSKLLEPYYCALNAIQDPKTPHDRLHPSGATFDFKEVFFPWMLSGFSSWLEGCKEQTLFGDVDAEEAYHPTKKGDAILAFICKESIIVAIDHSNPGTDSIPPSTLVVPDYIDFAPNVFGFVLGEDADSKIFFQDLPKQSASCSVMEFTKQLVTALLSHELKGFSGILIAGWDEKGPSLCCLDGEGKLFEGIMFACGSCSEFGLSVLGSKVFPYMSTNQAAKVAKIAIPTALALSKYESGDGVGGDEASESSKIGGSVRVYSIRHDKCEVAFDIDEDNMEHGQGSKRRRT